MIPKRLLRRIAARRRARRMRAKTDIGRQVNAATDAMLARHQLRRSP